MAANCACRTNAFVHKNNRPVVHKLFPVCPWLIPPACEKLFEEVILHHRGTETRRKAGANSFAEFVATLAKRVELTGNPAPCDGQQTRTQYVSSFPFADR
jgi:hypothetical protein